jgi:RNA recognition motif-containing protein
MKNHMGKSRGFAFITFKDEKLAQKCLENNNFYF